MKNPASKYDFLVSVVDQLRLEAPPSYKSYLPNSDETEKIVYARSLGFIHLLLKARFGVLDFLDRHKLITDGANDGGIDAFFIDADRKKLYLIQSKFRNTEENFENKRILADELLKMDISRITKGESTDAAGQKYNQKIVDFQARIREIRDIARYDYIVVLLGNVFKYTDDQIRRLIDNCNYEIFDFDLAYSKLVFPYATGTYYDPDEISIKIELQNKEHPKLRQIIATEYGEYNVTVVFVPIEEIGRIVHQYKNSILKYNPRNFLSLQKKSINEQIRKSAVMQARNNFALLNNGITLLSDSISIQENTGRRNEGQLIIEKPQILNGGQTAYTLSEIYKEFKDELNNPMNGKEVLIRVITPINREDGFDQRLIDLITNATNQQNEVSEADRRSNTDMQIDVQKSIYQEFGHFYERKSGEFFEGVNSGFLDKQLVVDRSKFIRAFWAYKGEPAAARRTAEDLLFREEQFYRILKDSSEYRKMFFAYKCHQFMENLEKSEPKPLTMEKFGNGLNYGKMAVISAIGLTLGDLPDSTLGLMEMSEAKPMEILSKWKAFEEYVIERNLGSKYFTKSKTNWDLYYKVNALDENIREYFLR